MERRPHPTYDRTTFRRAMACVGAAMVSILGAGAGFAVGAEGWPVWLGGVGFLAGVIALVRTPVNRCRCPACGEQLSRPIDSTEFPCGRCGVAWQTRGFGHSILE